MLDPKRQSSRRKAGPEKQGTRRSQDDGIAASKVKETYLQRYNDLHKSLQMKSFDFVRPFAIRDISVSLAGYVPAATERRQLASAEAGVGPWATPALQLLRPPCGRDWWIE